MQFLWFQKDNFVPDLKELVIPCKIYLLIECESYLFKLENLKSNEELFLFISSIIHFSLGVYIKREDDDNESDDEYIDVDDSYVDLPKT